MITVGYVVTPMHGNSNQKILLSGTEQNKMALVCHAEDLLVFASKVQVYKHPINFRSQATLLGRFVLFRLGMLLFFDPSGLATKSLTVVVIRDGGWPTCFFYASRCGGDRRTSVRHSLPFNTKRTRQKL